jgi:diguanylate cyclase (GGDEF)-like protein
VVMLISLLGALVAVTVAVAWHLVRRERTKRTDLDAYVHGIERDRDTLDRRRTVERDLEHNLEHAESEDEVIDLVRAALQSLDANRPFELHLVDAHEPMMSIAFATGATPPGASDVSSPWDSVAARHGTTLVYASTDGDDVCPHLAARLVERCSAICIPLLAMGRIVGVLYAMGPNGAVPSPQLVETYESIARATAANIATVRAFGHEAAVRADKYGFASEADDIGSDELPFVDEVTGLGDQAEALTAIDQLIDAGTPFSVVVFDIDELGQYHAVHGAHAVDSAMQLLAAIATQRLGEAAPIFRIDNDRFAAPLAGAAARDALSTTEHIRHAVARMVAQHDLPPFTISFGVVEAGTGTTAGRVLLSATDALYNARARGHDRVVVGIDVGSSSA